MNSSTNIFQEFCKLFRNANFKEYILFSGCFLEKFLFNLEQKEEVIPILTSCEKETAGTPSSSKNISSSIPNAYCGNKGN